MNKFKDKTAIITGGASGIGRALCLELAKKGAIVTVADINLEGAQEVKKAILSAGGRAEAAGLDVTSKDDVHKLIDDHVKEHGSIDYIFNNAGIGIIGDERDKSLEDWQKIIDINLMGVIYGAKKAYSYMAKQGSGHIVNTASIAGLTPAPVDVAYATVKHAVVGLSRSLRVEGVSLGVKVSAICPGVIRTPFFDTAPVLEAKKDDFMSSVNFLAMTNVDRAARIILRGVARNKARIVFPAHARIGWFLDRICPKIPELYMRYRIRDFRKISKNASEAK